MKFISTLGRLLVSTFNNRRSLSFVLIKSALVYLPGPLRCSLFSGRIILIHHILQLILTYHLMLQAVPAEVNKKLTRLLREFLWGFNDAGGQKILVVTWKKTCTHHDRGGLGLKDLKTHSFVLLCKWMFNALDNPDSKWALLFCENMTLVSWAHNKQLRHHKYNLHDKFLLNIVSSFGEMSYMAGLWKAWVETQKQLVLSLSIVSVPGHWRIIDIIKFVHPFAFCMGE